MSEHLHTPPASATPLHIVLDEQDLTLPGPCTLAELLQQLGRAPESVATALNGQFVPRDARAQTHLNSRDQVLLFKPIVGG